MNRMIFRTWAVVLLLCHALAHADGLDQWHVRYSPDGPGQYLSSIAFGQDRFVAVGPEGRILTSNDAVYWTLANSGTGRDLIKVASGNGAFVATGFPDTVIRSTDGTNWQSAGWQEPATIVLGVAFANGQFFLLASDEGPAQPMLFVSATGTEWSINRLRPSASSASLFSLAYGNSHYVAVGQWTPPQPLDADPGPLVLISQDTFTWENVPVLPYSLLWPFRVTFESVTFGKELFVAVGTGVNLVSFIAYSADGRKWELANDVFRGLYWVAYGDGIFVAAGSGQVATSMDGMHWRKRDPGHDFAMPSITFGRNSFLSIVGGGRIMQSDPICSLMLSRSSPLELSIFGPVGKICRVEANQDLGATNSWETIAILVLTNSPGTWVDAGATNKALRFYRASLQP